MSFERVVAAIAAAVLVASSFSAQARERWSAAEANEWYAQQTWFVGSNYLPANAINVLEMWQADTFDRQTIDKELGWAQAIGMNAMRVFLHNLLWEQDPEGFGTRVTQFLEIADRHDIRVIFVLFDSVWDPNPRLGPQHPPIPGVHNSGWVQAPGRERLEDTSRYEQLQDYVRGVIRAHARDSRVLAWDVWNEPPVDEPRVIGPTPPPGDPYAGQDSPRKWQLTKALLPKVFAWARAEDPTQPLTAGIWGDFSLETLSPVDHKLLDESDVVSFHDYNWPEVFAEHVRILQTFGRPILCTEFLARGMGSTIEGILPIAKHQDVGMFAWGLVNGKMQTHFPWDSWQRPYVLTQPPVWHHDVLRPDGQPYRRSETRLIKALSSSPRRVIPNLDPLQ
jgi:hypothetical protein